MRRSGLFRCITAASAIVTTFVMVHVAAVVGAVAIVGGGVLGTPSTASAQGMTFTEEEVGTESEGEGAAQEEAAPESTQPPPPPADGPPSEVLANALRLYQNQRYAEASVQFQRIVDGESQDAPANLQKAKFFLGKCLYHLRYYQSALAIFDEIVQQGRAHLYFGQTLQWLAQLATQLPESAGFVEKVGQYGVEQLSEFDTAESRGLYSHLLYLMGRFKYGQGEFGEATDIFQQVASDSPYYVKAKFFEGITAIRLQRARPAIAAFREILRAIDDGDAKGVTDENRMQDLAWISLARIYYTAANRTDRETGERLPPDGRLLGQAVEAWNQVTQSSEYWLDAVFESSWAFFLADEYSRALGNIHTLFSPYFESSYYPEALVIKAVTFFVNCQLENTEAVLAQFHSRYGPVKRELEQVLARFSDNTQFFRFLQQVRAGEADMSERIRGIVSTALSDRTLLGHVEYVKVLEAEEKRLSEAPPEFQNSSIGARILQDVAVAKSFAVDQAGDLARNRYARLIRELQDLQNQMDAVELELATFRRGQLDQEVQQQMVAAQRAGRGDVEVDEEHQLWPFNGEYWRDELGFYRQQVTNRCGR